MMSEKDRAVVLEMCRTGMSLEVLKKCFAQFDGEDLETLYNEQLFEKRERERREIDNISPEGIAISCNCS